MTKTLLQCQNISVSFGARRVFSSVNLSLAAGAYALRGPNGIGKSTLLKVISGAQIPDSGQVWLDGKSMAQSPLEAKRSLSYVPDESFAYPFMTGQDLLDLVSSSKKAPIDEAIQQIVKDFKIQRQLPVRFDAMSLGTQKKVMICAGFIGTPCVILMDEPSNGLDVGSRLRLEERVRAYAEENLILISTHDDEFAKATEARPILMEDLVSSTQSMRVKQLPMDH